MEAQTRLICLTLRREVFVEILGPLEQLMTREKSPQVITQRLLKLQTKGTPTHMPAEVTPLFPASAPSYNPFQLAGPDFRPVIWDQKCFLIRVQSFALGLFNICSSKLGPVLCVYHNVYAQTSIAKLHAD